MSETIRRRGLCSKEQLIAAVGAVLDGEMSAVEASRMYKIPQGTTRTHANNPALGIGADHRFYLTSKKEGYLVDLIKALEVIGVRLTKSVLKKVIGEYIELVADDPHLKSEYSLCGLQLSAGFLCNRSE